MTALSSAAASAAPRCSTSWPVSPTSSAAAAGEIRPPGAGQLPRPQQQPDHPLRRHRDQLQRWTRRGKVKRTGVDGGQLRHQAAARERDQILHRMPKMVLGVGARECGYHPQRYETFKGRLSAHAAAGTRQDIADIEPNVALVNGAGVKDEIVATGTPDDYCAVDFQAWRSPSRPSACVWTATKRASATSTSASSTAPRSRHPQGRHRLCPDHHSRPDAGALGGGLRWRHSLLMAQKMGLGLEYSCLPVAGSFYFAPEALNGKVYRVQNPKSALCRRARRSRHRNAARPASAPPR
jgi:hypothetical protein